MKGGFREVIFMLHFSYTFPNLENLLGKYSHITFIPTLLLDEKQQPTTTHREVMLALLHHCAQILVVESGCLFHLWSGQHCGLGTRSHQSHNSLILSPPLNPPAYLEGCICP